jgi:hypothetical protein
MSSLNICSEACCYAVERGGGGRSNASSLTPIKFPSRTVDILFKDDVTVILILGGSFMYSTKENGPPIPYSMLENKSKVPQLIIIWLCVCVCVCQLLQAGGWGM